MALVKCPECGKEVSSAAANCPQCGYPIAKDNPNGEVYIKMNLEQFLLPIVIYDSYGNELWRGRTGQTAILTVNGPRQIYIRGRGFSKTQAMVRAGEKYEFTGEGFGFVKDTLRRVDVISSGR